MLHNFIEKFSQTEAKGSIFLLLAALLALFMSNSTLSPYYYNTLEATASVQIGPWGLSKSIHHWINDGLMAIFFFMVGLEIKREILFGELSTPKQASLPLLAAIGGMVFPALVFYCMNQGDADTLRGWAIPCATDIAFALGVLHLMGNRIPTSVKSLLLSIAVIDDLGAIIIIAAFYTPDLSMEALSWAAAFIGMLFVANRLNFKRPAVYIVIGFLLWVAVLKSGVHATLAGVITALMIPFKDKSGEKLQLPEDMEESLHHWVSFAIIPAFAFANAGVPLLGISFDSITSGLSLGVIGGLVVGKQFGIMAMIALGVFIGIAQKPKDISWRHIYGVSALCGIGFTMSLFIGMLAFDSSEQLNQVRLAVFAASFISATIAVLALRSTIKKEK